MLGMKVFSRAAAHSPLFASGSPPFLASNLKLAHNETIANLSITMKNYVEHGFCSHPELLEEPAGSSRGVNWWWGRYVSALSAVSILISNVGDGVDHAIGSGVRVGALHYL